MKEFNIKAEVRRLPETPGVYLMHNEVDEIIYVGKAVNLKARVSQYFHHNDRRQKRIQQMIANIQWFEIIRTESELEALILESNLIKQYRPRYNAALRKDENHPYLRIDLKESYPVIRLTTDNGRDDFSDQTIYIGPFYKSMEIDQAQDWICKYFGLRTCSKDLSRTLPEGHPCMYYALDQCMAPCLGKTDQAQYQNRLTQAVRYLVTQDDQDIRCELQENMQRAAESLDFEKAARLKDMLEQLAEITRKMNFTSRESADHTDLFAAAVNGSEAVILLYLIRSRRLSGRDIFILDLEKYGEKAGASEKQSTGQRSTGRLLQEFVSRFYENSPYIPAQVILTERIQGVRELERVLSEKKGSPVACSCPKAGENGRLVQITRQNAEEILRQKMQA